MGSGQLSGESRLIPENLYIPDKLYFKIGEVSAITGVEPHVLRYWEAEFKVIKPQRASSNQRLYRRVDVENVLTIKKLLQEDGFTIPGARKFFAKKKKKSQPVVGREKNDANVQALCKEMKTGLEEIKRLLET